jgi:hypothetical protein
MINSSAFRSWTLFSAALLLAATIYSAETPPAGRSAATAPKGKGVAKGPLPDPQLLDGSNQQADKKSEEGMLGEFEIPGDEDVRNGKVGGPEKASVDGTENPNLPQNGGSAMGTRTDAMPGQLPMGGGPESPNAQGGGGPPPQGTPAAGGGPISGPTDPNAVGQGIQVADLQGEPQGVNPSDMPQKPPAVAIGDSAMQIQGIQNAPNVVGGSVPAGQTQQMEKNIGGGGKGAAGNNSNRGAEKGRVMPSGL